MATHSKLNPGAMVRRKGDRSVPDDLAGRVHDEIMRLDGGVRRWEHMGESQRAAWRNGLSILTPTPPAVASGEAEIAQLNRLVELRSNEAVDNLDEAIRLREEIAALRAENEALRTVTDEDVNRTSARTGVMPVDVRKALQSFIRSKEARRG